MKGQTDHSRLLEKFLHGTINQEEIQLLQEWLHSGDAPADMNQLYRDRWMETQKRGLAPEIQQRMFRNIKQEMKVSSGVSTVSVPLFGRSWMKYAAVIALFIISGIAVSRLTTEYIRQEEGKKMYTVSAAKGQRATVVLPDGTQVWLNSHTELTYTGNYGNKDRCVTLDGEAYFEVAEDKKTPFRLSAGEVEVEVLGTCFNVKAYKEDDLVTASLFTGKIKVSATGEELILEPNQYVVFSKQSGSLSLGNMERPEYARQWKQNKLAFDKETLSSIALRLNRLYNIEVVIESEELKDFRFSGTIRNNSLDNILEFITFSAPITYQLEGDTIYLRKKE